MFGIVSRETIQSIGHSRADETPKPLTIWLAPSLQSTPLAYTCVANSQHLTGSRLNSLAQAIKIPGFSFPQQLIDEMFMRQATRSKPTRYSNGRTKEIARTPERDRN